MGSISILFREFFTWDGAPSHATTGPKRTGATEQNPITEHSSIAGVSGINVENDRLVKIVFGEHARASFISRKSAPQIDEFLTFDIRDKPITLSAGPPIYEALYCVAKPEQRLSIYLHDLPEAFIPKEADVALPSRLRLSGHLITREKSKGELVEIFTPFILFEPDPVARLFNTQKNDEKGNEAAMFLTEHIPGQPLQIENCLALSSPTSAKYFSKGPVRRLTFDANARVLGTREPDRDRKHGFKNAAYEISIRFESGLFLFRECTIHLMNRDIEAPRVDAVVTLESVRVINETHMLASSYRYYLGKTPGLG